MFEQTTKHCSGTATTKLFDMIEYIRGELAELTPAAAIIDCNGVGYLASISLNTYSAIQGKKSCKLYVYEAIREDAYQLYGFADKQERELFLLLISVSGIGGRQPAEDGERHRPEDCPAHHRGPEGQDEDRFCSRSNGCRAGTSARHYCQQRGDGRSRSCPYHAGLCTGCFAEGGTGHPERNA